MRLLLALAILLTVAPAISTATAAPTKGVRRPGQVLPRLAQEVRLAVRFWHARGVTGCPNGLSIETLSPSEDGTVTPLGLGGGCRVWLSPWALGIPGAAAARTQCALIVHEVGHALGLQHTPTGIMAGLDVAPHLCTEWARRFLPRRARARAFVRRSAGRFRATGSRTSAN